MTISNFDLHRQNNLVQKRPVQVTIQTTKHLIRGNFFVRGVMRVMDELAFDESFIAVTEAEIFISRENLLLKTEFVAVNREEIVWMAPDEDVQEADTTDG